MTTKKQTAHKQPANKKSIEEIEKENSKLLEQLKKERKSKDTKKYIHRSV